VLGVQRPIVSGSCDANNEFVNITFRDVFNIVIYFGQDKDKNVVWKSATIGGQYVPGLFPNASGNCLLNWCMNNLFVGPSEMKFGPLKRRKIMLS